MAVLTRYGLSKWQQYNRQRWCAALRSGSYPQGEGALVSDVFDDNREMLGTEYCCLGVAQKLFGMDDSSSTNEDDGPNEFLDSDQAMVRLGITEEEQHKLAMMNDDPDISFIDIANHIETLA